MMLPKETIDLFKESIFSRIFINLSHCSPAVMQIGDWPYGAVGGFAPSKASTGYGPLSELGSRTCEITRHASNS